MTRAGVAGISVPLVLSLAWTAAAQQPAAAGTPVRFDVASVRPHRAADDLMFALQFHEGGRLTATATLRMLIRTAYRLQDFQIVADSGWIDDERFDIDARASEPASDGLRRPRVGGREPVRPSTHAQRRDSPRRDDGGAGERAVVAGRS